MPAFPRRPLVFISVLAAYMAFGLALGFALGLGASAAEPSLTPASPAGAASGRSAGAPAKPSSRPGQTAGAKTERHNEQKRLANENAVSIMAAGLQSGASRYAEEIRNLLDEEKPGGLRVVPILGRGGAQNILDIIYLKGVDMGFAEQDALLYLKKKDPILYLDLQDRIQYIMKISNSELHLLARNAVRRYADLRGRKVNCLQKLSSTDIACETIFEFLALPVQITNFPADIALRKLKDGEIDAFAQIGAAPLPSIAAVTDQDGLRLVPFDRTATGAAAFDRLRTVYLPATLKSEHYPNLIAPGETVPTLANSIVLATHAWPKDSKPYQRLTRFVNKLFDNIDAFRKEPLHPKWRDVNLATVVPGWKRFGPAQAWLDSHQPPIRNSQPAPADMPEPQKFESFLRDSESLGEPNAGGRAQRSALSERVTN